MTAVLCVGLDPATMDFSQPGIPAGMTVETLRAALAEMIAGLRAEGYDADTCGVDSGATAGAVLGKTLAVRRYDCVLIGAGVRLFPQHTLLLETLVNTVREHAPGAKLCFNTSPADSLAAVRRWVQPG